MKQHSKNPYDVTEDFRNVILESQAWSRSGVKANEVAPSNDRVDEGTTEEEEEVAEDPNCPLCTQELQEEITDEMLSQHVVTVVEAYEEAEEEIIQEAVESGELHSCPLCESVLEEEISDEVLIEHFEALVEAMEFLNEESEDEEEDE